MSQMLKEEQKREVKNNSKGWVMEEELDQVTMKLSEYKGRHV